MNKRLIVSYIIMVCIMQIIYAQVDSTEHAINADFQIKLPPVPQPPIIPEIKVSAPTHEELSFLDRFNDDAAVIADKTSLTTDVNITSTVNKPEMHNIQGQESQNIKQIPDIQNISEHFTQPWEFGDPNELIDIEFDNAELLNFILYIEKKYKITFIMDDQIKPLSTQKGAQSVLGTKISFKTHKPLSKKQAWNIFVTFLDMAGLAPQPGPGPGIFRLANIDSKVQLSVYKGPLPLYIGVDPSLLPDNDTRIRYVYFVENTSMTIIQNVIDSMRSSTSPQVIPFPELRALIITDKATNIRSMLAIIQELDKVNMPETLSIIKLKRTDATKVAELYKSLLNETTQTALQQRLVGGKKPSTLSYFGDGTRIIPEPNTNSLILLGSRDAIKKIEDFIVKEIDRELDIPFSPLHIYKLKFVEADAVAAILKESVKFQPESEAAQYGGVRNGNKYFRPMNITAEKSGNRLIINADYEDFLKIYELLEKIDVEQPQVAIKILILSIDITDQRNFGVQVRNKVPSFNGLLGGDVNFQTSGLNGSPIIENSAGTGATRLLGDLVQIVSGITSPGSTVLTFGSDQFGVWGILNMLQSLTKISTIANPFLVTTHKYPAKMSVGTIRRVVTGTTLTSAGPEQSFADLEAKLEIAVTPQVSYEGLITLDVSALLEQFTQTGANSGDRTHKEVKTSVIVADNDVVALGGLIIDTINEAETKIPWLGDIPIIGWFFKNKNKTIDSQSLLILITPEIIPPHTEEFAERFTELKLNEVTNTMNQYKTQNRYRDPINRWFFRDPQEQDVAIVEDYLTVQNQYIDPSQKEKLAKHQQEEREKALHKTQKKSKKVSRLTDHFTTTERATAS